MALRTRGRCRNCRKVKELECSRLCPPCLKKPGVREKFKKGNKGRRKGSVNRVPRINNVVESPVFQAEIKRRIAEYGKHARQQLRRKRKRKEAIEYRVTGMESKNGVERERELRARAEVDRARGWVVEESEWGHVGDE